MDVNLVIASVFILIFQFFESFTALSDKSVSRTVNKGMLNYGSHLLNEETSGTIYSPPEEHYVSQRSPKMSIIDSTAVPLEGQGKISSSTVSLKPDESSTMADTSNAIKIPNNFKSIGSYDISSNTNTLKGIIKSNNLTPLNRIDSSIITVDSSVSGHSNPLKSLENGYTLRNTGTIYNAGRSHDRERTSSYNPINKDDISSISNTNIDSEQLKSLEAQKNGNLTNKFYDADTFYSNGRVSSYNISNKDGISSTSNKMHVREQSKYEKPLENTNLLRNEQSKYEKPLENTNLLRNADKFDEITSNYKSLDKDNINSATNDIQQLKPADVLGNGHTLRDADTLYNADIINDDGRTIRYKILSPDNNKMISNTVSDREPSNTVGSLTNSNILNNSEISFVKNRTYSGLMSSYDHPTTIDVSSPEQSEPSEYLGNSNQSDVFNDNDRIYDSERTSSYAPLDDVSNFSITSNYSEQSGSIEPLENDNLPDTIQDADILDANPVSHGVRVSSYSLSDEDKISSRSNTVHENLKPLEVLDNDELSRRSGTMYDADIYFDAGSNDPASNDTGRAINNNHFGGDEISISSFTSNDSKFTNHSDFLEHANITRNEDKMFNRQITSNYVPINNVESSSTHLDMDMGSQRSVSGYNITPAFNPGIILINADSFNDGGIRDHYAPINNEDISSNDNILDAIRRPRDVSAYGIVPSYVSLFHSRPIFSNYYNHQDYKHNLASASGMLEKPPAFPQKFQTDHVTPYECPCTSRPKNSKHDIHPAYKYQIFPPIIPLGQETRKPYVRPSKSRPNSSKSDIHPAYNYQTFARLTRFDPETQTPYVHPCKSQPKTSKHDINPAYAFPTFPPLIRRTHSSHAQQSYHVRPFKSPPTNYPTFPPPLQPFLSGHPYQSPDTPFNSQPTNTTHDIHPIFPRPNLPIRLGHARRSLHIPSFNSEPTKPNNDFHQAHVHPIVPKPIRPIHSSHPYQPPNTSSFHSQSTNKNHDLNAAYVYSIFHPTIQPIHLGYSRQSHHISSFNSQPTNTNHDIHPTYSYPTFYQTILSGHVTQCTSVPPLNSLPPLTKYKYDSHPTFHQTIQSGRTTPYVHPFNYQSTYPNYDVNPALSSTIRHPQTIQPYRKTRSSHLPTLNSKPTISNHVYETFPPPIRPNSNTQTRPADVYQSFPPPIRPLRIRRSSCVPPLNPRPTYSK